MRPKLLGLAVAAALAMSAPAAIAASVGTIAFDGNTLSDQGQGFGNILVVLTLQHNGTEWGSVGPDGPDGGSAPDTTGHAANTSTTRTIQEILTYTGFTQQSLIDGTNQLALVLNISQEGNDPQLGVRNFSLDLYNAGGSSPYATVDFTAGAPNASTTALTPQGNGFGQGGAGWLFLVNIPSLAARQALFGNVNNFVGMTVLESQAFGVPNDSNDGPDDFAILAVPVVPVPAAAWTGMSVLAGLGLFAKLRRKLQRD